MTDEEYLARLGLLRLQSGKRKPQEPVPAGSSVLDVPIGGTRRIPDTVLRRPAQPENTITGLPEPSMAQRHAESLAGYLTPKVGGPRARAIAQTALGGDESALPFGIGLQELVPFSPYVAEEAGRMVRSGVETGSPLEIGLGLGLGALQASPAAIPIARGAKAVGKRVREAADPEAIRQYVRQTQGLTGMPGTAVVKPKGGNWLQGNIETSTEPLKRQGVAVMPLNETELADFTRQGYTEFNPSSGTYSKPDPVNTWIDKKLNKYIRNEMGTPEDPVRKLAERGILHFEPEAMPRYMEDVWAMREKTGFPKMQGTSSLAQKWEAYADQMIRAKQLGEPIRSGATSGLTMKDLVASEPGGEWALKASDDQMIYELRRPGTSSAQIVREELGLPHLIDELRNAINPNSDLPAHLRWKPEDLDKVTMSQAVERVSKINDWRAAQMEAAKKAAREGIPVHKQYEGGYQWMAAPDTAKDPKSLKYIQDVGCESGWCTQGESLAKQYGGGGNQLYVLHDPNGKSVVQISVRPARARSEPQEMQAIYDKVQAEANAKNFNTQDEWDRFYFPRVEELQMQMLAEKSKTLPPEIVEIKGRQNRPPKDEHLPMVQDFVRSGNWSRVGDLQNTGLARIGDKYFSKEEIVPMIERASRFIEETPALKPHREATKAYEEYRGPIPSDEYTRLQRLAGAQVHPTIPYTYRELRAILDDPSAFNTRDYEALGPNLERIERLRELFGEQGYAAGGLVENTDTLRDKLIAAGMDPEQAMTQALRMADQVEMAGGGLAKAAKAAATELKGKYKALPLELPRASAMTQQEIEQIAERIARQQLGEHVRKPGDTKNLAGRSLKEAERLKKLSYSLESTKTPPLEKVVPEKKGQVRVALPGDISVADKILVEVEGLPIGVLQQGGPKYGAGKMDLPDPRFWASNIGPASNLQRKIDDLAMMYETPEILAEHMAMGPVGMNFAQHLAKTNLMAINSSMPHPKAVEKFNEIIRKGFVDPQTKVRVEFPDFPGVENYKESNRALMQDPELRKWFNNRMKTEKDVTAPLNFPRGKDFEYAISEPELRDLEIGMTGLSVGQMQPGASLIKQSAHKTYSHDIPGLYLGRTKELLPVELAFPDALSFIKSTKRPADVTSTMQKVFPHQVVDEQYINELGEYYDKLRKIRGFNEGGVVKPEGADDFAKQVMQKIANQQVSA